MLFFVWKISWSYCEIRTHYFKHCLTTLNFFASYSESYASSISVSRLFFHPAILMTSPYPSHPSSPPRPIVCLSSHSSPFLSFLLTISSWKIVSVASKPTPSSHQVPSRLLVFGETSDLFGPCISLGWMRKVGKLGVFQGVSKRRGGRSIFLYIELKGSGAPKFLSRKIWPVSRIPVHWGLFERRELDCRNCGIQSSTIRVKRWCLLEEGLI